MGPFDIIFKDFIRQLNCARSDYKLVLKYTVIMECQEIKLVYLGIQTASKKSTMPIPNWALTLSQLPISVKVRLNNTLGI